MHIGIAGAGRMGTAIAQRLMEVGHKVTVWNRSAGKLKAVSDAGAAVAATPADLAGGTDIVITLLTDAAAIDAVYNGPSGLLASDVRGKLFIEMSTVQPRTEVALGGEGARQGRGPGRMSGRRVDRPGAARQADRVDGRRAG